MLFECWFTMKPSFNNLKTKIFLKVLVTDKKNHSKHLVGMNSRLRQGVILLLKASTTSSPPIPHSPYTPGCSQQVSDDLGKVSDGFLKVSDGLLKVSDFNLHIFSLAKSSRKYINYDKQTKVYFFFGFALLTLILQVQRKFIFGVLPWL